MKDKEKISYILRNPITNMEIKTQNKMRLVYHVLLGWKVKGTFDPNINR